MKKSQTLKFGINQVCYCFLSREIREVVVYGATIQEDDIAYLVSCYSLNNGKFRIDESGLYETYEACRNQLLKACEIPE